MDPDLLKIAGLGFTIFYAGGTIIPITYLLYQAGKIILPPAGRVAEYIMYYGLEAAKDLDVRDVVNDNYIPPPFPNDLEKLL